NEIAGGVDRRQFVSGSHRNDQIAMNNRPSARSHDQTTVRRTPEGHDSALDLALIANIDRAHLHAERWRYGLDDRKLANAGGYGWVTKDRRPGDARRDLLEQFQPFPTQTVFELHKAGGVTTGPGQTIDEAGANRIGDHREHDRHCASRFKYCLR